MNKTYTIWQIRFVFLIIAAALAFTWSINAAHADTTGSQLSIAASGQVIAKDAQVIAVSGDTITATTGWGALRITWTIHTSGSTRFVPDVASAKALQMIKVGDSIAFSGDLDSSSSNPVVTASVVKNTAIEKDSMTVTGNVMKTDPVAGKFTVSTDKGTATVTISAGTIMTLDGNLASINNLQKGAEVKAVGSFNTTTNTMLASKVTWKTPSMSVASTRTGMFSGFFNWLLGSRGALSTR